MPSITLGTRGSKLALRQAHGVEQRLNGLGVETEIEIIQTTGDKFSGAALAKVGSESGLKGIFTKEIEEALLDGRIDAAVHSLKDLPVEIDRRLVLSVIPRRADPRDALAGRRLEELQRGARVGAGSLRRAAQLRRVRPDVKVVDIRGNIDTRLRKLDEGRYDAIVLACAGLQRLGWEDRITEALDINVMVPAVGQGALGVETRAGDDKTRELLQPLHDRETAAAAAAERALLRALGGGCQTPLGALGVVDGDDLELRAAVVSPSGEKIVKALRRGRKEQAEALGRATARRLLAEGAGEIIQGESEKEFFSKKA